MPTPNFDYATEKVKMTFMAGQFADLPVSISENQNHCMIDIGENLKAVFDPIMYANQCELITRKLNFQIDDMPNITCINPCAIQSGRIRISYQGTQMVHDYHNQAPWKARNECVVKFAALLQHAKEKRDATV